MHLLPYLDSVLPAGSYSLLYWALQGIVAQLSTVQHITAQQCLSAQKSFIHNIVWPSVWAKSYHTQGGSH